KGFSTTGRPKPIAYWIKCARRGTPAIGEVKAFAKGWQNWWEEINPTWRLVEKRLIKETKGSLDGMRVPGKNGFLSVLIGLKWWREAEGVATAGWAGAVDDVTWV
ncbi:hypothetical protein B0H11DRAFT_1617509, partial [Mycena galericulata]